MAKITKKDLEVLSSNQIRDFLSIDKNILEYPTPIREFLTNEDDRFEISLKIGRVIRLLNEIIIQRFINDVL